MMANKSIRSLPQGFSRSEAACRAFRSLPADERESFVSGFESAARHGVCADVCAQDGAFMQNTQNPKGILY